MHKLVLGWVTVCWVVVKLLSVEVVVKLLYVGVDFVFPRKKEGRKKEGRNNPHLASSRRNDPTCLNFG